MTDNPATTMQDRLIDWLLGGKTGASSKCMAAHLTGRTASGDYPHDSGDFERCAGLLRAVPELRPEIPKMASLNSYWAALAKYWGEIEATPAKQQYEKIQSVIRPIEKTDSHVLRTGANVSIRFGGKFA